MKHRAWLISSSQLFYAEYERTHDAEPFSSVTELVQGIWNRASADTLSLVRSRIFTTESYSDLSWGMVRIAAARVTFDALYPTDFSPNTTTIRVEFKQYYSAETSRVDFSAVQCQTPADRALWIGKKLKEVQHVTTAHRYDRNRAVVAAIFDKQRGCVVSFAHNNNARNRTLHAEVLVLQKYWSTHHAPLLLTHELWCSLEPCKMCAGMIATMWPEATAQSLYFLEHESGPSSRNSTLAMKGIGTKWVQP